MLEALSSNAVLTKVKAMYGRMLTTADYEQLMHRGSVPACAAYLKTQTAYAEVLRDVQETQIHRGALEGLLGKMLFEQFIRLERYVGRSNRFFHDYHVSMIESRCILDCIRLFDDKSQNEYMQSVPGYMVPYLTFDVLSLGKVGDFSMLLDALRKTPYYKVLEPLRPRGGADPALPMVEHALYEYYYNHVISLIDKQFRGKTAKELKGIFSVQAQLHNIQTLYRLKSFFGEDAKEIEPLLLRYPGRLPRRTIDELVHAPDAAQVVEILSRSRYSSYFVSERFTYIEYSAGRIRFDLAKRYLTFSQHPATSFVAFMVLREIEINNLMAIIEGVRYQLEVSQIRPLLIYGGD